MTDSTLSLGYTDFIGAIAEYLGYGFGTPGDATELAECDRIMQAGIRQAYYPVQIGPELAHEWSFLTPTTSLVAYKDVAVDATVTVSSAVYSDPSTTITASSASFHPLMVGETLTLTGVGDFTISSYTSATIVVVTGDASSASGTFSLASNGIYTLPDDFGGMDGCMTFTDQSGYAPVTIIGEPKIRELRDRFSTTSRPEHAAVRWKSSTLVSGQKHQLVLYPEPDADYTLNYRYHALKNKITSAAPYPLGGMAHGQMYLASCLAEAEKHREDSRGAYWDDFLNKLRASISIDQNHQRQDSFGYMGPEGRFSNDPRGFGGIYHNNDITVNYTG